MKFIKTILLNITVSFFTFAHASETLNPIVVGNSISPIDIAVSAFFLPKKISPIPQIAKLKISMPNKTFIKIDVTLERINCSMLNPIHRKMWHLN